MQNKLLVTGATGFIGSHLTELLVEKGFDVVAFDRYNPNNNWGWLENSPVKNDVEVILGDIRDFDSVNKAMQGCDSVFHLAALIGIPYSYVSPLAYIRTNVEGTYNILEAVKNREVLGIEVDFSLPALRVIRVLDRITSQRGYPLNCAWIMVRCLFL